MNNWKLPYVEMEVVSGQWSTEAPWKMRPTYTCCWGPSKAPHVRKAGAALMLLEHVGECCMGFERHLQPSGPSPRRGANREMPLCCYALVPSVRACSFFFFGSKLHLLREGPEDASDSGGDPQWHLPAGPQPAGWKLKRLICVQVPG